MQEKRKHHHVDSLFEALGECFFFLFFLLYCTAFIVLSQSIHVHSLCTGGSLRGQGWKYGSGFVDGIFPVLSPDAQQILNFMKKETDVNRVWGALSSLPPTHTTWDDIISVAVQLRLNKKWDPIILVKKYMYIIL